VLRLMRLRTQASNCGCPGVYRAAVSRAAAGLCAALLLAGCAELSTISSRTYAIGRDVSDLKRDQEAGFKKMEFSLAKQQESLDTQRDTLTSLREDIEKQLAELRRDLRGGAASAEPGGVTVTPGPGVVTPPPGTGTVSPGPVVSPPPVAPPPPPTEEQLLQTAEEQVAARNYQKAVELYTAYLQDHAASARAPEAMLRLGKCYYEMTDRQKARQTFNDLIDKYPGNATVVPVAYHSRAVCELVQNDLKAAKATLDKLQALYPDYEREQIAKLRKNYFPQP